MQLKALFFALSFITTALCATIIIIPVDPLPCVPSSSTTTCLLNYSTNSGAVLDLADPKISASAFIYSNTCLQLGGKSVAVPGQTTILSWGLNYRNPPILGSEKREGTNWWTPWFEYDGQRYRYEDCSCSGDGATGGHMCSCLFRCKLWLYYWV
ncbi:uncharacterized protein RAG0_14086 [Rhynchosporium agropyri]|uniref:Cyanovirin-N domain-containing protein n=2 Tax=Rhynchosporium TaxID=38037 RepID=A0A1E1LFV1_9HELO|nr:uncharacterized protein RCO7_14659 [Rhynchosporium commune]CZT09284.1 uncharacterized protein RAG0_14086 [Rhynchosporium agropyri]